MNIFLKCFMNFSNVQLHILCLKVLYYFINLIKSFFSKIFNKSGLVHIVAKILAMYWKVYLKFTLASIFSVKKTVVNTYNENKYYDHIILVRISARNIHVLTRFNILIQESLNLCIEKFVLYVCIHEKNRGWFLSKHISFFSFLFLTFSAISTVASLT